MWAGAGFADRFIGEIDQLSVEEDRLDAPDAVPFDRDVSFFCEALTGILRLLKHAAKRGGIEMTLVERDPAFLDHARDDPRFGCAGADRADAALPLGDAINLGTHLRGREERI